MSVIISNMSTVNSVRKSELPFKCFNDFIETVLTKNWSVKKVKNELIFYKESKELIFRILTDKIEVSIPLRNSDENYVTTFDSYFEAQEYGMMQIDNTEKWIND